MIIYCFMSSFFCQILKTMWILQARNECTGGGGGPKTAEKIIFGNSRAFMLNSCNNYVCFVKRNKVFHNKRKNQDTTNEPLALAIPLKSFSASISRDYGSPSSGRRSAGYSAARYCRERRSGEPRELTMRDGPLHSRRKQ